MITLGYWLAVFPTDMVLPDDVKKPDVDWSLPEEERGITEMEKQCTIYFMDRRMTLKNLLYKPTPEFVAECESCCKDYIVESNATTKLFMGLMHVIPFSCMVAEFCHSSVRFYYKHYWLFCLLSIEYIGINLL